MYKVIDNTIIKYRVALVDYKSPGRNLVNRISFKLKCLFHGILIEKETKYPASMRVYRINVRKTGKILKVMNFPEVFSVEEDLPA